MKFWKILKLQIEKTLPGWGDKFISYKELKKRLKVIGPNGQDDAARINKRPRLDGDCTVAGDEMTREETDFTCLLEAEIEKFNTFFVEKEEEYIIKQKLLQDRAAKAIEDGQLVGVWKEIVDLHGEMVLLENYSALNYTGLVKILKKYEKRTGDLIRLPFIQKILQQPFFATDVLNKLVKECETMLDSLFPASGPSISGGHVEELELKPTTEDSGLLKGPKELAEIEYMESLYIKSTWAALQVLKEIRSGSSTVSVFSLPPLQSNNGLEENLSRSPVLKQVAKDVIVCDK